MICGRLTLYKMIKPLAETVKKLLPLWPAEEVPESKLLPV
jgi:hypothetical protein